MKYRSDVDGLRAVAVSLVLLFHAHLGVSGGYVGVDVFFVISGFLITRVITDAQEGEGFSLLRFYDHRARRILPALVPVMLVATVIAFALMLPLDLKQFGESLLATAFFGSNIFFWRTTNYFHTRAAVNPLLHTWSLGVEEQFYIFFPLLMMLLLSRSRKTQFAILAILTAGSFALSFLTLDRASPMAFYLLPMRAWELLLGSLLSFRLLPQPSKTVGELASIAGIALIGASALLLKSNSVFPGPNALPPTLGAALILYAGIGQNKTAVGSFLSLPPLRFVGLISYSLYLWHWPLISFYTYAKDHPPTPIDGACLLLIALLASTLSWRYVEQPWRRRAPGTSVARAPLVGLAAMFVVGLLGATLWRAQGVPSRFPRRVTQTAAAAASTFSTKCDTQATRPIDDNRLCVIGASDARPTWLLWGDSYAWALQMAFSDWLAKRNAAGWVVAEHGCAPLLDYRRVHYPVDCEAIGKATRAYIRRHHVTDIILVAAWTNWFHGIGFSDSKAVSEDPKESAAVLARAFDATVEEFHRAGVRIWVMDPLPRAKQSAPEALAKRLYLPSEQPLEFTKDEYQSLNKSFFAAIDRTRPMIAGQFMPENELCRTGRCAVQNNQGPLYADDTHAAAFQSAYFARLFERNLWKPGHR